MRKITIYSLVIFIIDQIVKIIISLNINLNTSVPIIKNIFYISNVHNYGAAFSILYGNRMFLIIISFVVLISIYHYILRNVNRKIEFIIYTFLIGGIIGNLFDRIVHGYVIDYLDFNILGYNFPIFNIADICIVTSMAILIIDMLLGEKNENKSRSRKD